MRFFYPALAASFVAVVAGAAIDTTKWTIADLNDASEVVIQEHCRGLIKWSEEGFFRSGSTVRYHGHMWQCARWSRGEDPESSDVWRDLGACDPDAQQSQSVFSKRSTSNIQTLDDDDEDTNCRGNVEWADDATYRSGTTIKYGNHLWQTSHWSKGDAPSSDNKYWSIVATCSSPKPKMVKRSCDGTRRYDGDALIRSGTTVEYNGELYQAKKWTKGAPPTDSSAWTHYGPC